MLKLKRVSKEKAIELEQPKYYNVSGCSYKNHIWFYTNNDKCVACSQIKKRETSVKKPYFNTLLEEIKYYGKVYEKRPVNEDIEKDLKHFSPFKEVECE